MDSVQVVNEKERERRALKAPRGWGLGRGIPFPYCAPSPENFFFIFFLSGSGAFWCILGACFNVSLRRVKQSRKAVLCANCQWSVISHGGRIIHDIIHINTHIRVSSQPVRHTCSLYYGHSRHTRTCCRLSLYTTVMHLISRDSIQFH